MKQYFKKKPLLFLIILAFYISAFTLPVSAHFAEVVISCTGRICAANYALNVTIVKEGETTPINFTNGTPLAAGTYTVKLEKTGTATKGFCLVKIGDETYYTNESEFTITLGNKAEVTFTPHWGEAFDFGWHSLEELSTEPTTESSSAEEPTTVVNSES